MAQQHPQGPRDTHTTVVRTGRPSWLPALIIIVVLAVVLYLLYANGVFGNRTNNTDPGTPQTQVQEEAPAEGVTR